MDLPRIPEMRFPELDVAYSNSSLENHEYFRVRRFDLISLDYEQRRFPEGEVLDVCCGVGDLASFLATQFPDRQITGIDIDPENIRKGSQTFEFPNLVLRVGDAYKLQQYAGKMALVTSIGSLHHLDNLDLAIEQAANALVPNGVFYIQDFDRSMPYNIDSQVTEDDLYRMRQDLTEKEFRDKIKELVDFQDSTSMRTMVSLFSHMAGYTCDEVINAIEKQNLRVISRPSPIFIYGSGVGEHFHIVAKK